MNLSVVVATHNRAPQLRESLRALLAQTLPPEAYEIVVVDDGSTDDTAAVLQEFGPRLTVVRFQSNRGISAARNEGIRRASGTLVIFVDSDIIVRSDYLGWHLTTHQENGPRVLGRGPVVLVPDVHTALDGPLPQFRTSPAYLDAANASVERSVLVQAGLFDEKFPGYGWEDFELGVRLRRLGIRRVFCRQAVAFHLQQPVTETNMPYLLRKEEERAKSAVYFYRKHPTPEVRLLIQATPVHRFLYWIQSGCGALQRENVQPLAGWLQARGLTGLTDFAVRGVLNRYYLARLRAFLADGATGSQASDGNLPGT
jgi:GT2 family glycosyltransferase